MSSILDKSDDRSGKNSRVARRHQYSDIDLRLRSHPSHGDVSPLNDLDAVRQSIRNLIMTARYERVFNPNLGCGVKALLFEPADNITMSSIREEVVNVLTKYEPRVKLIDVDVIDQHQLNSYTINIFFRVISTTEEVSMDMYLERVR